jgi:hypothetical protein
MIGKGKYCSTSGTRHNCYKPSDKLWIVLIIKHLLLCIGRLQNEQFLDVRITVGNSSMNIPELWKVIWNILHALPNIHELHQTNQT